MIIYFSGTGNSEYIAKAIADALGDEAVSANPAIKAGRADSYSSKMPYIFVFPVYISIMPAIFRDYIARCRFLGNRNAYFVPTCAGTDGSVPNAAEELCGKTGMLEYKGCRCICMPQNYVTLFKPFSEEKKAECYRNAKTLVAEICDTVRVGRALKEKPVSRFEYTGTKLVERWYNKTFTVTKYFRSGDACIGCAICEKVCPTNSIRIENGRPVWKNTVCIHCMACISRCPKQTIEYGRLSVGKKRHVCPVYIPTRREEK